VCDEVLADCSGSSEYALYIKALVKREQGCIQESLTLFQAAAAVNPYNLRILKQVARSMFLLGRHAQALELYEELLKSVEEDWEVLHYTGLCHMNLGNNELAEEHLIRANLCSRHETTSLHLARLYVQQEQYEQALETLQEALEVAPENAELLTQVGLVHLRQGANDQAFDALGKALAMDPRNAKAILAAGSILQDHQEMDVALSKYRILAAGGTDAARDYASSAQLWNNIGMAFFGKGNHIAAIACLKRALYFSPLEWIVAYNLGLVFLNTGQFCSAFHYLSAAINLKPDFAPAFVHLALALSRLDDVQNAISSYERSLTLDPENVAAEYNYAVLLFNSDAIDDAKVHFAKFERLLAGLTPEQKKLELIDWEAKRSELQTLMTKRR
jgi:Bardet-Biedl syndrome 4 protein